MLGGRKGRKRILRRERWRDLESILDVAIVQVAINGMGCAWDGVVMYVV